MHGPDDRARVALVGQTALLLGGDALELYVDLGAGACLELLEVAATVAYHGRGRSASWCTTVRVGEGARLDYAGEPLVVSDGADVTRVVDVDLAAGAVARLRETVVFGRAGERGGRLDAQTVLRRAGAEFCREHLVTDATDRARPGILAGAKVLDSVLDLGTPAARAPAAGEPGTSRFRLLEPDCTLTRYLGTAAADSPLGRAGRRG